MTEANNIGMSEASPPPQVFHFTSMDAMMSIVEKRVIWCTAIPYLNDSTERIFLLDAVRRRLPQLKKTDPSLDRNLSLRTIEVDDLHVLTQLANEPFIASFSETGDSLMHWRSYCPQHSGIAIGFRTDCLSEARIDEMPAAGMVVPSISFGRVGYLNVRDEEVVDSVIYRAVKLAQDSWIKNGGGSWGKDFDVHFQWAVETLACINKHESFQVEGEHRLLLSDVRYRENNIRFRTVRSTLIPYVGVRVPSIQDQKPIFDDESAWNAIRTIVIGPTANMALTEKSVRAFFQLRGMDVEVHPSQIPYRDW